MSEGFELVRSVRQHLRRGGTLLQEGQLDQALVEAEAALALDPDNLPAQTLRERIGAARLAALRPEPDVAPIKPGAFVPHGVNAASWRGFEQRIQERRFRALLETINTSLVAGDAVAARAALEEARELKPDAPELASFEPRIAAAAVSTPAPAPAVAPARVWMRALSAAAMLILGVSMLVGLEWVRPSQPIDPPPAATTGIVDPEPAITNQITSSADQPTANAPDVEPVPTDTEDDSIPAIVTPPEPTLRPRATTGTTIPGSQPIAALRQPDMRDADTVQTASASIESSRVEEDLPIRPVGEVPDDYVTQAPSVMRSAGVILPEDPAPPAPTPAPRTASVQTPAAQTPAAPPQNAASTASAAIVRGEQNRVEAVLRQYARAYDELNASAARAVWPSVDEKALARAFQGLASQNVSFENCDIDVRGAVANASCRGQYGYVGKVGSREQRTELRTWRFELRREGEGWKIENAEARRESGTSASYR